MKNKTVLIFYVMFKVEDKSIIWGGNSRAIISIWCYMTDG